MALSAPKETNTRGQATLLNRDNEKGQGIKDLEDTRETVETKPRQTIRRGLQKGNHSEKNSELATLDNNSAMIKRGDTYKNSELVTLNEDSATIDRTPRLPVTRTPSW